MNAAAIDRVFRDVCAAARSPSSLMNVLADGRARTKEEIARMIRPLDEVN